MKNELDRKFKNVRLIFGVTKFDYDVLTLAMGMGKPGAYWEYGIQVQHMNHARIPEHEFYRMFTKLLDKGMLRLEKPVQLREDYRARRYVVTDRGWETVCDVEIAKGGDYRFYKEFDGNADNLSKFEPTRRVRIGAAQDKKARLKAALSNMSPEARAKWKGANPQWVDVG